MDNQMNQYDNGGYNNNRGGSNGNGGPGGGNGNGNKPPQKPSLLMIIIAGLSTLLIVFMLWDLLFGASDASQMVSYTKFLQYLDEGRVETVEVQSTGQVLFTLKPEKIQEKDKTRCGECAGDRLCGRCKRRVGRKRHGQSRGNVLSFLHGTAAAAVSDKVCNCFNGRFGYAHIKTGEASGDRRQAHAGGQFRQNHGDYYLCGSSRGSHVDSAWFCIP